MAPYAPPIREIEHALYAVAGMDEVAALPGFEEATPDLVHDILQEAGRFAANVLSPINRSGDVEGCRLVDGEVRTAAGWREAHRAWIEAGWGGISFPAVYGGHGLPRLLATAAHEMWHGANMAFTLNPMLTNAVADAILLHGTDTQKAMFVPKLITGEWTGTMCLTEPQAGSDLGAIRCKAVPDGDRYRISGQKVFITYGDHDLAENIVHMVLARIPGSPEGVKGISLFIVPKMKIGADGTPREANGVRCVGLEHKLGIHGSPTCVLAFGDGAEGFRVGAPNRGLEYMFTMMNASRLAVGVQGLGIAERAFQAARDYARERIQGRAYDDRDGSAVPIIRHPDVRRMLMTMKCQIEAMRGLAYRAAAWLDHADKHPDRRQRDESLALAELLTPAVKGWCTEEGVLMASAGIQVHGGTGYIEETGVAQHLRDARITTIYEGTTGIQANDLVGRKVLRNGGATVGILVGLMRGTLAELDRDAAGTLPARLAAGIEALEKATHWLVEQRLESGLPGAAAVPYLHLLGTVAGGWAMAHSAGAASRALAAGTDDEAFCRARLATSQVYAEHVLPRAPYLAETVVQGSAAVIETDEASI